MVHWLQSAQDYTTREMRQNVDMREKTSLINPLMTEFLSNGTHFAPEGPDLVTQAHMGSPSCNSINDHPEPRLLGVRGGDIDQPDIMLDLLKLGPDLAHHTGPPAVGLCISLNPKHRGGCSPFNILQKAGLPSLPLHLPLLPPPPQVSSHTK